MHTCTFCGQLNTLTHEFGFDGFILLTSLVVVHLILMIFYIDVLMGDCGVWNFDV